MEINYCYEVMIYEKWISIFSMDIFVNLGIRTCHIAFQFHYIVLYK